ncbi:MAG: hypothetical protein KAT28_05665 [Candidatus Aenigmarchaeota archaeon]|nr:hypothetical protein [Candidatus Aenigmarchaeota archaeon]
MIKNFSELDYTTQRAVGKLMTPEVYNKSFATLDSEVYNTFIQEIKKGKTTRPELIVYGIIRPIGNELCSVNYAEILARCVIGGKKGVEEGIELRNYIENIIGKMLEERNITVKEYMSGGLENLYLNSVMYAIQHTK